MILSIEELKDSEEEFAITAKRTWMVTTRKYYYD